MRERQLNMELNELTTKSEEDSILWENQDQQVLSIINNKKNIEKKEKFTFVDLFSGIGGFRIPIEKIGGKCLGFSEIDKRAIAVYKKNFLDASSSEIELGDITKLSKLPFENIDLIVGGVPCQAWSVAGKMKGFEDPRGKLWHDTIRVIEENKPKAFIFENVKGLIDPRNKENLELIISSFEKIGYKVKRPQLLNSYDFGLPQNRERVFIVGVRRDLDVYLDKFEYPKPTNKYPTLSDFIEGIKTEKKHSKKEFKPEEIFGNKIPLARNKFQKINSLNDFFVFCDTRNGHTTIHSWDIIETTERERTICMTILKNRRKKIYGNSDGNPIPYKELKKLISGLKKEELKKLCEKKILRVQNIDEYEFVNSKNSSGINGVYRIYLPQSNVFSTLTATGSRDYVSLKTIEGNSPEEYKRNFIKEIVLKKQFRKITPKEAGRLQGFPSWFKEDEKEQYAKKQFGNAVSTTVIYKLVEALCKTGIFYKSHTHE